ncbi:MAG: hypothetical protein COV10_02330 [Candidatus Vogelbacteria bacterium CG10_big_fil_rev_8_21_14_0_10_51_16]|uniref:Transposase IS200-like domain-containing protein n=1 Tax=Candidatus Vogelbacteria bacterium CG10_big_fil_rev_8_21_14_0_10_51_16 TaxID=1975045 RepID=A0A2H0REM6_9BACT|nr:MAG: hypothetical protein COV10_02330 [Candidatus Vogelbacteria bacterium CG10_big_fil_rev_8_21_14_0_10_51_16]
MRNLKFENGEYYHIYNHAIEGRDLVLDRHDANRWVMDLVEFNKVESIGSLREAMRPSRHKPHTYIPSHLVTGVAETERLVDIICRCLNPNHFHLVLSQRVEGGISAFMHKLGMGYSHYYNTRYQRKGRLYQDTFKATFVTDNDYLLYLSVYTNLNDKVHQLPVRVSKELVRSSWGEYTERAEGPCDPSVILKQFRSVNEYKRFAAKSLQEMLEAKKEQKELRHIMFEFD